MILPGHPLVAIVTSTMKTVKDALDRVANLGGSTKDTIALENANDVLDVFALRLQEILPDMLGVVCAIEHKQDISTRVKAKAQIDRLHDLCVRYSPAFKDGGLAKFSIDKLFPTSLVHIVGCMDMGWRAVIGIIEESVKDHAQMEMIDKFRGALSGGIPFINNCLYAALTDTPDMEKLKVIRKIEQEWILLVQSGRDKYQAYRDLETKYSENDDKKLKAMLKELNIRETKRHSEGIGLPSIKRLFHEMGFPEILRSEAGEDDDEDDDDDE